MQSYKNLIEGYLEFKKDSALKKEFYAHLHLGQNAEVLIISCCVSRVVPNIIMKAEPGEIFITRNIAALVPPYDESHTSYHATSAAIEYAVKGLKVKHIIIMGHTKCGGIESLVKNAGRAETKTDFIGKWMKIARPALEHTLKHCGEHSFEDKCTHCEKEALKISLSNLMSFPFVKQAAEEGKLQTHAMLFDIKECALSEYNPASGEFEEIN